ncbi:hypothetical protein RGQ29_017174 [Quercus rubra]|uniref:Uncharacterized protein n=1 Tax=Quercus rubra TaxID=3512 RepID=A0AAN7J0J7_QUERU|nr:hypothetical protein RGQ29_017174 [Quercus rubra]
MRIYAKCICCPQKPNTSLASSTDQCAFNNGEEDPGRVGIRGRLRRRNHRPTHARRPQKHYLSRFGWLQIRFQLWKRSFKPWRRRITNGLHDQGLSSILNTNAPNLGWDFSGWRRNKFMRILYGVYFSVFPSDLYTKDEKGAKVKLTELGRHT